MPKQRKKPRHIKKKAVHAANCGIGAVGSFGMAGLAIWFLCFVPAPKAEVPAMPVAPVAVKELEPVSKPVVLKPLATLSKSSKAIALAELTPACEDVHNWGCVLEAGRKK